MNSSINSFSGQTQILTLHQFPSLNEQESISGIKPPTLLKTNRYFILHEFPPYAKMTWAWMSRCFKTNQHFDISKTKVLTRPYAPRQDVHTVPMFKYSMLLLSKCLNAPACNPSHNNYSLNRTRRASLRNTHTSKTNCFCRTNKPQTIRLRGHSLRLTTYSKGGATVWPKVKFSLFLSRQYKQY